MNIIELLTRYIRPHYKMLLFLSVFILFVIVAYFTYKRFYSTIEQNKFKNVANANRRNKEVNILFFHVDWCPHCRTAQPEWDKFTSQMNGKEVNGYVINCVDMDCTNDKDSSIASAINQYNIESYPTIKMLKDEKVIEFQSKITTETLNKFITTMTNN